MSNISSNFVQRFITACFLSIFSILAIFYSSFNTFILLNVALFTLAVWEWSHMNGYQTLKTRIFLLCILWMGCIILYWMPLSWMFIIAYLLQVILVSYTAWLLTRSTLPNPPAYLQNTIAMMLFLLSWRSFCYLKTMPFALSMGLLIITLTDTLGYLTGTLWGGKRFASNISPNKTWVGFWNALLIPAFLAILIHQLHKPHWKISLRVSIFVFMTTLMALVGDLLESFIKRKQGIKDSGQILPGHGGLLDRLDSIITAIPVYAANCYFFKFLG